MSVKTINLEAAIQTAIVGLDDLPGDSDVIDAVIGRLRAILPLVSISANETFVAGCEVCLEIFDYACGLKEAGRGNRADLYHIFSNFRNDLHVWHHCAYAAELEARKNWVNHNIHDGCITKWESNDRLHYVELRRCPQDYYYTSGFGCGSVCNPNLPVESAVLVIQSMLARGCFLPDAAKLPMKRVL